MANSENVKNKHFILEGFTDTEKFKRPASGGGSKPLPDRDRKSHGTALLRQIDAIKPVMSSACLAQKDAGLDGGFGLQIEFESFPDIDLAFESLAREKSGIELLNARHEGQSTYATVFVPDEKLKHFEGLISDYLE